MVGGGGSGGDGHEEEIRRGGRMRERGPSWCAEISDDGAPE